MWLNKSWEQSRTSEIKIDCLLGCSVPGFAEGAHKNDLAVVLNQRFGDLRKVWRWKVRLLRYCQVTIALADSHCLF